MTLKKSFSDENKRNNNKITIILGVYDQACPNYLK